MNEIQFAQRFYASGQFTPFAATVPGLPSLPVPERDKLAVFNVATPPGNTALTFTNVPPENVLAQVQDILGGDATADWVKKFTIGSFDSYTDGLSELANALKQLAPACVLVPLRGGLKPRQVLDGMLNHSLIFEEFGFTDHTKPDLARQYETELRGMLSRYATKTLDLRLAVVDAGIGGDGGNHLAQVLRNIHREIGGSWTVVFHLLYVARPEGNSFPAIPDKSEAGFSIRLKTYPVHHLLVEDWAPGIGLIGERDSNRMIYKQSVTPGAVFAADSHGYGYLAVSDNVCDAVDQLISHLGTQRLFETRNYEQGRDVYDENRKRFDGPKKKGLH